MVAPLCCFYSPPFSHFGGATSPPTAMARQLRACAALIVTSLLLALSYPHRCLAMPRPSPTCAASPAACAKLAAASSQQLLHAQLQQQRRAQQGLGTDGLRASRLLATGAYDAQSAPRPLRIFPEFQVPLDSPYRPAIEALVSAAILTLQGYLQVRRPAGVGGLLAVPTWFDADSCSSIQEDPQAWSNMTCSGAGWMVSFNSSMPHSDVKFPSCDVATINASHVLSPDCHDPEGNISCHRNAAGGEGGEDADLYLYITMNGRQCDNMTVAYSTGCGLYDPTTNRPTVGMFNFCNASFDSDLDDQLSTVVHEVVHILGFNLPDNAEFFINRHNQLLGGDNVLQRVEFDSDCLQCRSNYTMVITPTVVREVRRQFDCPTLEGAPLEEQGGDGSASTHWETELFQGELMTPSASRDGSYDALTRLTLALMEDSGWYVGNWSAASYLRWGRRAGCTFATRTCTAIGAPYFCPLAPQQATSLDTAPLNSTLYSSGLGLAPSNASERQLPQEQEQAQQQPQQSQQQPQQLPQQPQQPPQQLQQGALDVCTFDGMSRANCNQTVFSDCPMLRTPESMREPAVRRCSCTHPAAYFNSDNASSDYAAGLALGAGWEVGANARCLTTHLPLLSASPPLQLGNSSSGSKGLCWSAKCNRAGTRLYYRMKTRWLYCPAGRTLDLSRLLPNITLGSVTCPSTPGLVCASLACPPWCSPEGGRCVDGRCYCNLGYYGHGCNHTYLPRRAGAIRRRATRLRWLV